MDLSSLCLKTATSSTSPLPCRTIWAFIRWVLFSPECAHMDAAQAWEGDAGQPMSAFSLPAQNLVTSDGCFQMSCVLQGLWKPTNVLVSLVATDANWAMVGITSFPLCERGVSFSSCGVVLMGTSTFTERAVGVITVVSIISAWRFMWGAIEKEGLFPHSPHYFWFL